MTNDLRNKLGMLTGEMYTSSGYFKYKGKDIVGEKIEICIKSEPTKEGLQLLRQKVKNHKDEVERNLERQKKQEEMQMNIREIYRDREMTVYQAAQAYIYQMTSFNRTIRRKANTLKSYDSSIKSLSRYNFMNYRVVDVTRYDARAFLERLAKEFSGNTVKQLHTFLKCVFAECMGNGCIGINPFSVSINPDCTVKEALSKTQQEDFLNYVYKSEKYCKYYDYIVILMETGLRLGEFLGLTVDCINFAERRIIVSKQVESNGNITKELKTRESKRYVEISDKAEISLQNIIANLPKRRYACNGFSDFLIVTRNGKPKAHTEVDRLVREIRREYQKNVDKDFPDVTPHTFRHTFATNKALEGMSILKLYKQMGHSDYNTTLNVYVHLKDENGISINAGMSRNEVIAKYDTGVEDINVDTAKDYDSNVIQFDFQAHRRTS